MFNNRRIYIDESCGQPEGSFKKHIEEEKQKLREEQAEFRRKIAEIRKNKKDGNK